MPPSATPPDGPRYALAGRIVTLDARDTVLDDGVLYVTGRTVTDIRPAADPAPDGFAGITPLDVGGSVYPGLIEPHNHLPYDALDEIRPTGAELRPRLPLLTAAGSRLPGAGRPSGPVIGPAAAGPDGLAPVDLDRLTASADRAFLAALAAEKNLPGGYGTRLSRLLR